TCSTIVFSTTKCRRLLHACRPPKISLLKSGGWSKANYLRAACTASGSTKLRTSLLTTTANDTRSVSMTLSAEPRTPKAYLTRRYWFSASHRLHSSHMDAEQNQHTYGKCDNPYGHGHNYALEVTVGGPVGRQTGMVTNLADLDRVVEREILTRFDHMNLNM